MISEEAAGSARAPASDAARAGGRSGWRRWLPRDPYALVPWLLFAVIVVCCWVGFVDADEEIYLLGSRRLADPGLLALDITWGRLSPTTALYDHMIAPLWSLLDAFTIVNLGRGLFWALMAWSLARLGKRLGLPAWSVVAGFAAWLLWKQTLGTCGSPFQGFQPKSFAYPLVFLALDFAVRGRHGRAGLCAGFATAFHIVVGGWACLALFASLLVHDRRAGWRPLARYLAGAGLFVAPVLAALFLFRTGQAPAADASRMSEIYALFAMPHCCDPDTFLAPDHVPFAWLRAGVVFVGALVVLYSWRERRGAAVLGTFTAALIAFYLGGVGARRLELYGLLTLYPFQLANALPALLLFVFYLGGLGTRFRGSSPAATSVAAGAPAPPPANPGPGTPLARGAFGRARRWVEVPLAAGMLWLAVDGEIPGGVIGQPQVFAWEVRNLSVVSPTMNELDPLYGWIRENTPRNSVFITPLLQDFWPYAERAQVASMRQPPLDHAIVEWERRLIALNRGRPYEKRGFETEPELAANQPALSVPELVRMREEYGATHYLIRGERADLAHCLLHSEQGYSIYDVARVDARE
jgi:hypothetical protein